MRAMRAASSSLMAGGTRVRTDPCNDAEAEADAGAGADGTAATELKLVMSVGAVAAVGRDVV